MIEFHNISKTYGYGDSAVNALSDITLKIPEGKFVSIVGKSGSGKSTMMNLVGALDKPTGGSINSDGQDLTSMSDDQLAEYRNKHIGYIFQSFYLEPTFTVLENVAMPLTIAGEKKAVREEAAKKVIAQLGLSDKISKKASELSGGQKQRVSIARALVHNPKVVLADEPTGNLDSHNGAEVIKLLQQIADSGKTVILVTHNIEDAYRTDIMIVLKDGKVDQVTVNDAAAKGKAQKFSHFDEQGTLKSRKK